MVPAVLQRLEDLYIKLAAFNVENLFVRKKEPGPRRTVFVNENLPEDYLDKRGRVKPEHVYPSNQVLTSKYTIITFIPRNLLEQFRRIANIFFLGIAILQFFNKFKTISPGLVILPLLIVLGITALKDGYEDIKRHQSDRRVNHTPVRTLAGGGWSNPNVTAPKTRTFVRGILPANVLRIGARGEHVNEKVEAPPPPGEHTDNEYDDEHEELGDAHPGIRLFGQRGDDHPHWRRTAWEDVRVGDFIKIKDNESIPADMLICSTSGEENVAYVETKNLDGETNLKSRHAVPPLTHLRTARDCADRRNRFKIEADRPDVNMYKLNAKLSVDSKQDKAGEGKVEEHPVDMQMMLLRGTVLRNTEWVIGVVVYTGEDTRIVMNAGGTPSKRSKVERQMNPQVFINLIILALMAIACAIVDSVLEHRDYPRSAPWLYNDNGPNDNPSINGLVTWAFALITFQNIVPISLYISIEFVRTCQAAFIYFDTEMMYEKTGQAPQARSWNLSDDLGQIEYIFSDKTGTLTQNSMVFRKCSIAGKVYPGDPEDVRVREADVKSVPVPVNVQKDEHLSSESSSGEQKDVRSKGSHKKEQHPTAVPNPPAAGAVKLAPQVMYPFSDSTLTADLEASLHADPNSPGAAHARSLNGFFTVLALCHTVITGIDSVTGAIEYKAQSPDEAALVQAAADVGFVFRGREGDVMLLQTPFSDEVERYQLLNILEFTSSRKRMSVVLRKLDEQDQRIFLLCKGADNVIFERLREGAEDLKAETGKHLGEFASEGLRTLTLAYKVVPEDEYEAWNERYHEATVAMDNREEKIEAVSDELERDLRLLGATAIEDRLQDGVPETIADLKRAGIKIWVATGDKLETAIAIGHSTNLVGRESNIIVIRGNSNGRAVWEQMVCAAEEFFPEARLLEDRELVKVKARSSSPGLPRYSHDQSDGRHPLRRMNTGLSSIVGANNGDRPGGFVLVIDGAALDHALGDEKNRRLLLKLATQCEGVICCRTSPLQKALIVRLVREGLGVMTLAIGDGANDVSMIQSADVGVGIAGEEGLQAVNSSDYAIAQFRFLKRLLLVHGHWSYARNGNMILNFFYKNIVCIGVLWWFQIYCAWSSTYVFEYTFLLFWNSFWTLCPVIAIGLFDRIVDARILMELPELYRYGRQGNWFSFKWFSVYMLDGVMQSAVIFFLILYAYVTVSARPDGWQVTLYEFSTTMVFSAVLAANLFNGLNTNVWTGWVWFAVLIGLLLLWIYTAIYASISPGWFVTPLYGYNHILWPSAFFWFCMPLTVCIALAPRYLAKAWKFGFAPDDIDIMRYISKMEPDRDVVKDAYMARTSSMRPLGRASSSRRTSRTSLASALPARPSMDPHSGSRTDMSTGVRSVHRGFDFSTEEGGVAMQRMQTNLSERRQSSRNLALTQENTDRNRRAGTLGHVFSVRRGFLRKKTGSSEGR
ncbi:putative cation transport ATPase (P-type) (TC 3.A.3) family, type IV subfamily protein [Lyophyllum shimeji]|uniref:Phospholipid-transporting ATPase n=1 Tax=Lyophyllum shimeji TaxID=47721 RepID=A0A9P3UIL6_LYOSH|nr:putative cation transport ATPase (P-type) (TC 3.A.3) family, type IV subfamily protein [Lyophyllum shimeji]